MDRHRAPQPPGSDGPERWLAPVVLLALLVLLVVSTTRGGFAGHSAILWFALLITLAMPLRAERWVGWILLPAAVIFTLWFLDTARSVSVPFGVGLLLAYLLDPVVDRLERRLGRTRAIVVLALPALALLGAFLVFVVPLLLGEAARLVERLPELREPIERLGRAVQERAGRLGVRWEWVTLAEWVLPRLESAGQGLLGAGIGVWRGVQGLVEWVSFLVITPVVGFYLLRDFDRLRDGFLAALGPAQREAVGGFLARTDRAVSAYLRGQLLVGLVVGAAFAAGLAALGFDYALLVGLCAVVLNLVPYVGSVLTAALALAVALLSDPSWSTAAQVIALYGAIQVVDGALLSPRIMGDSLGLHPAFVMAGVLVAGQFLGVAGVVVGVPATALAAEGLRAWAPRFLSTLPGGRPT